MSEEIDITPYEPIIHKTVGLVVPILSNIRDAPFKRVLLLFKTQNELIKQGRLSEKYDSVIDLFYGIIQREGVLSLWRGLTLTVFRSLSFELIRKVLPFQKIRNNLTSQIHKIPNAWKRFFMKYFVLTVHDIVELVLTYPIEVIRILYMIDLVNIGVDQPGITVQTRLFNGIFDVIQQVYHKNGISGFYYGLVPSILGVVVYKFVTLAAFEILEPFFFHSETKEISYVKLGSSRFISFNLSNMARSPFDIVRARLVLQNCYPSGINAYTGVVDAIRKIVDAEGFKSLYKGLTFNTVSNLMLTNFMVSISPHYSR